MKATKWGKDPQSCCSGVNLIRNQRWLNMSTLEHLFKITKQHKKKETEKEEHREMGIWENSSTQSYTFETTQKTRRDINAWWQENGFSHPAKQKRFMLYFANTDRLWCLKQRFMSQIRSHKLENVWLQLRAFSYEY